MHFMQLTPKLEVFSLMLSSHTSGQPGVIAQAIIESDSIFDNVKHMVFFFMGMKCQNIRHFVVIFLLIEKWPNQNSFLPISNYWDKKVEI